MGKMDKFYEGWVRMTAHPVDNLGVTKDLWFFNHGDKESRFEVRNFVHSNLCAGYVVVTTPMNREPSEWEWEDARNFPGKPIKEETKPCKVNVIVSYSYEEDKYGNVLLENSLGGSLYFQGDDAVRFLEEVEQIEGNEQFEYEQLLHEFLSQYKDVMEAPESL